MSNPRYKKVENAKSKSENNKSNNKTNNNVPEKKTKKSCIIIVVVTIVLVILFALSIFFLVNLFNKSTTQFFKKSYPIKYSEIVEKMSDKYDVEEDLIYAVIRTESGFDATADSPVGAVGLMQIMPSTFEWLQTYSNGEVTMGTEELYKPEVNIEYGTIFLRFLLDRYKAEECAVAGYNAGFGAVDEWLMDTQYSSDGIHLDYIPYPETENYVEKVESAKAEYKKILSIEATSAKQ